MGKKNKQKQIEEASPEHGARPVPGFLAAAVVGAVVVFGWMMLPRGGVVPPDRKSVV